MKPWSFVPAGRFDELSIDSELLKNNVLGDPHERPLWVYTPPGYDASTQRYPSIYVLQGMTGQLDMWKNRGALRPSFLELLDAQFAARACPPAIVVLVDCWTRLGGSQFVDSPGTGRYHSYLCDEIVPFVDARYRTLAAAAHRGIAGKSSGGYGAMITPMLRPDLFGGLASHAGDALFELCFAREFATSARALRDEHGGSWERFWQDFRARPAFSKPSDDPLVNDYAMAACYSAEADGSVRLPYDAHGRLVPEVWARWLAWDPVRMAPLHAAALRGLRAIYLDAGKRDEFFLDLGAEAFRAALADIGVEGVYFELFEAGHFDIEYRYPKAIAYLAERLTAR